MEESSGVPEAGTKPAGGLGMRSRGPSSLFAFLRLILPGSALSMVISAVGVDVDWGAELMRRLACLDGWWVNARVGERFSVFAVFVPKGPWR